MIIAKHPCIIPYPEVLKDNPVKVKITEDCNGCMYCIDFFECPALLLNEEENRVEIDRMFCVDCGVCLNACPRGAIIPVGD